MVPPHHDQQLKLRLFDDELTDHRRVRRLLPLYRHTIILLLVLVQYQRWSSGRIHRPLWKPAQGWLVSGQIDL